MSKVENSSQMTAVQYMSQQLSEEMDTFGVGTPAFQTMLRTTFMALGLEAQEQTDETNDLSRQEKKEKKVYVEQIVGGYKGRKVTGTKVTGALFNGIGGMAVAAMGFKNPNMDPQYLNALSTSVSSAGQGISAGASTGEAFVNADRTAQQEGKENASTLIQSLGQDKSKLEQNLTEYMRAISEQSKNELQAMR